jgi:hypothetical protein
MKKTESIKKSKSIKKPISIEQKIKMIEQDIDQEIGIELETQAGRPLTDRKNRKGEDIEVLKILKKGITDEEFRALIKKSEEDEDDWDTCIEKFNRRIKEYTDKKKL